MPCAPAAPEVATQTASVDPTSLTVASPPEGSSMGVGDTVKFWIDAEFTGPPAEAAPT